MQTKKELSNVEIERGNRSIADFMGIEFGKAKYSYRPGVEEPLTEDHLAYHSSWDWIMPALKKFGDLPTDDEIRKYWNDIVNIGLASIDIKLTWKLFVEAIQWYNNQQKQVKE